MRKSFIGLRKAAQILPPTNLLSYEPDKSVGGIVAAGYRLLFSMPGVLGLVGLIEIGWFGF